jgi:ABC-type phosphate transport system permease subunit
VRVDRELIFCKEIIFLMVLGNIRKTIVECILMRNKKYFCSLNLKKNQRKTAKDVFSNANVVNTLNSIGLCVCVCVCVCVFVCVYIYIYRVQNTYRL